MSTNTVNITLEVTDNGTLKVRQFSDQTRESARSTDTWTSALKSHWLAISASGAAIALSVSHMINYAKSVAQLSEDIERQSQILGVSTTRYQEMRYAAKLSGVENEEFSLSMKMLARSIEEAVKGESQARQIFAAMGITVDQLKNKKLDQIFLDVAEASSKWEDGGRKVDYVLNLMGHSAERMIPQMNKGKDGLAELSEEAHKSGKIIDESIIKQGALAEDAFKRMAASAEAFKLSLAPLVLTLAGFLEKMTAIVKARSDWDVDPITGAPVPKGSKSILERLTMQGPYLTLGPNGPGSKAVFGMDEGMAELKKKTIKPPALPDEKEIERQKKLLEEGDKAWFESIEAQAEARDKYYTDLAKIQQEANDKASSEEKSLLEEGDRSLFASIDAREAARDKYYTDLAEMQRKANADEEKLLEDGLQATFAAIDAETEARFNQYTKLAEFQTKKNEEAKREQERIRDYWNSLAGNLGESAMMKFFSSMHNGFRDMGDMVKSIGMDIIAMIEKMIANAIVFGNVMGQQKGVSGGLSGLFGGFLGSIFGRGSVGGKGGGFETPYVPWGAEGTAGGVGSRSQGQTVVNIYDNSTTIQSVVTEDAQSWEDRRRASIQHVVNSGNRLLTPGRRR